MKFGNKALALHFFSLSLIHPTIKEKMTFEFEPDDHWDNYF